MACDIHCYCEVNINGKWQKTGNVFWENDYDSDDKAPTDRPIWWRSYDLFGFLAGVRSIMLPQLKPVKGIPTNLSKEVLELYLAFDYPHTFSWYTLEELLIDYDNKLGKSKALLGELYFEMLEELKKLGEPDKVRIVFWFDS